MGTRLELLRGEFYVRCVSTNLGYGMTPERWEEYFEVGQLYIARESQYANNLRVRDGSGAPYFWNVRESGFQWVLEDNGILEGSYGNYVDSRVNSI